LNQDRRLTTEELIYDVKLKSGKGGGWPNDFDYRIDSDLITISTDYRNLDKKATRRLDPWGLAFLIDAESRCRVKINAINFSLSGKIDEVRPAMRLVPNLEAFRRRVSFLSLKNPGLRFGITINGEMLELDDTDTLFNRPSNERIRTSFDRVAQDNRPGRLEKDFQTWLFANDVKNIEDKEANINERLAVLGEDFYKLKKKAYGIIREFPTGAFHEVISNNSRLLPTEYIDIVTLNKYGHLAVIELKLNDPQLEVIAQLLDYSLFFRCYRDKLWPTIVERLRKPPKSQDIVCYVVSNHFHDRFDKVMKYYCPNDNSYGFRIKKVTLGSYSDT